MVKRKNVESSCIGRARSLHDAIGVAHVTDSALAQILERVLPDADITRRAVSKASVEFFNAETRYGPVGVQVQLPLASGSTRAWDVLSPQAQLAFLTEKSPKLTEVLRAMRPPSYNNPWGIQLYYDEVVPGNPLDAAAKRRKCWNILWTFREMPRWALHDRRSWFLFGVLRSQDLDGVPGGLSAVIAVVLRQFLVGAKSFQDAGVPLRLGGTEVRVYARMLRSPADGGALQQAFGWLGAGSTKPCLLCLNCLMKGSDLVVHDPCLRTITCTDISQFVPNTDAALIRTQDILASLANRPAGISAAELKTHEQLWGFRYYEHSWLQAPDLRRYIQPCKMVMLDAMHIYFSDGAFDHEISGTCEAVEQLGVQKEDWIEYPLLPPCENSNE